MEALYQLGKVLWFLLLFIFLSSLDSEFNERDRIKAIKAEHSVRRAGLPTTEGHEGAQVCDGGQHDGSCQEPGDALRAR